MRKSSVRDSRLPVVACLNGLRVPSPGSTKHHHDELFNPAVMEPNQAGLNQPEIAEAMPASPV